MANDFDPISHLIQLQGRAYLEVKWRIKWFREKNPGGSIETEMLAYDGGTAIFKATVFIDGTIVSTGTGSCSNWRGKEVMKAETAAIGRALAHAGYGTQFTGEDETDLLADSPVENNRSPGNNQRPGTGNSGSSSKPFEKGQIDNFVQHFMFRFERSNHIRDVFASLKVNNLHEISGDYATAIKVVVETAYNNMLPVRVEYVKYVIDGKKKYLVFCADPSNIAHRGIRAYGRSTTVKNALNELRDNLYESLALDQLASANNGLTTAWYPLDTHLLVGYEVKDGYTLATEFKLPEDDIPF